MRAFLEIGAVRQEFPHGLALVARQDLYVREDGYFQNEGPETALPFREFRPLSSEGSSLVHAPGQAATTRFGWGRVWSFPQAGFIGKRKPSLAIAGGSDTGRSPWVLAKVAAEFFRGHRVAKVGMGEDDVGSVPARIQRNPGRCIGRQSPGGLGKNRIRAASGWVGWRLKIAPPFRRGEFFETFKQFPLRLLNSSPGLRDKFLTTPTQS